MHSKLILIFCLTILTQYCFAFGTDDFEKLALKIQASSDFKTQVKTIKSERKKLRLILKNYDSKKSKDAEDLSPIIAFEEVLQRLELKSNSEKDCKAAENEIIFIDSTSTSTQKSKEAQWGLRLLSIICKK